MAAARLPWFPLPAEPELAALLVTGICDDSCMCSCPCGLAADDDCSVVSIVVAACAAGGTALDGLRSAPTDSDGLSMTAKAAYRLAESHSCLGGASSSLSQ